MKKLVVLTGAGISAESGISTFRDADGLWERHRVEDVASIEGWHRDPALMQEFYNQRRRQLAGCQPNAAHRALAEAEGRLHVDIVTQNVDNLHERAGSTRVLHLHGELTKARSVADDSRVYDIGYKDLKMGDLDDRGHQLRPHIVWFGEAVPMIEPAARLVAEADALAVVGTSLNVYPAAGLLGYAAAGTPIYVVDPKAVTVGGSRQVTYLREPATTGVPKMLALI